MCLQVRMLGNPPIQFSCVILNRVCAVKLIVSPVFIGQVVSLGGWVDVDWIVDYILIHWRPLRQLLIILNCFVLIHVGCISKLLDRLQILWVEFTIYVITENVIFKFGVGVFAIGNYLFRLKVLLLFPICIFCPKCIFQKEVIDLFLFSSLIFFFVFITLFFLDVLSSLVLVSNHSILPLMNLLCS